jgi:hypothetical protein
MVSRRHFIQQSSIAGVALSVPQALSFLNKDNDPFSYESPFLKIQLRRDYPQFSFFSVDSLGGKQFALSPLATPVPSEQTYISRVAANSISYYLKSGKENKPVWVFGLQPKMLTVQTHWIEGVRISPMEISFAQKKNHCTVLGVMNEPKQVKFPCVLHFPGLGSFRLYCSNPRVTLFYDADRSVQEPFVKIDLQAASAGFPDITYRFEPAGIYPDNSKIRGDARFDGFRRNYINIYQLNPSLRALANNSASDVCALTLFLYAEMAKNTPALVEGLTAMHLVRNTLELYLEGMKGFGMVGYRASAVWQSEFDSLDSLPSLIMSACYYILDSKDKTWAEKYYPVIKEWATKMISTDTNNDGIIEYGYSGNSGTWQGVVFKQPANWWDDIGFGHDDAYSNALAYRACTLLVKVTAFVNEMDDNNYFDAFAKKLKGNYYEHFYNPDTHVLGGWRSKDGVLHDYYFTFVNSVAITYGLIETDDAKRIMMVLMKKMKEVGFTDFRLGLPGNLIPIADNDYADNSAIWGYQHFQTYENGGATGCYVYYTIHALYQVGMKKEAEEIFMSMMESYKAGSFQGNCEGSDRSKDWKDWKGGCWGYEGFLVDNYLAVLAMSDYVDSF